MFEINAITLTTDEMADSVRFWMVLGLEVTFGGPDDPFTSLRLDQNFVNLMVHEGERPNFWGRVVFHVPDPDSLWEAFDAAGYVSLTVPADAPWGERYFHIVDPGGHEISFARLLSP